MSNTSRKQENTPEHLDTDMVIAFGDSVKAAPDGVVEGWLVRFTDENTPDLTGEYFDDLTDLDIEPGVETPTAVYYQHGLDQTIGSRRLAKGIMTLIDNVGVWIKAQLQLRDEYDKAIYELARQGKLGWSSATAPGLVKKERKSAGAVHLTVWPLGIDASLTPTPAAGPELTKVISLKAFAATLGQEATTETEARTTPAVEAVQDAKSDRNPNRITENNGENTMNPEEVAAIAAQAAQDAIKAQRAEDKAAAEAEQAQKAHDAKVAQEAIDAFKAAQKPENDPGLNVPNIITDGDPRSYDNYSAADLSTALEIVKGAGVPLNPIMIKALARRLQSSEANDTEDMPTGQTGIKSSMPGPIAHAAAAMKANEANLSTSAGFGDEWVGVAYSGAIWEAVRAADMVVGNVPSFEFPAGAESIVIPVESTDPVWYKVAQAANPASATAQVANVVPSQGIGTAQAVMTLGKMGTSVVYSGEMVEDSVLPFVAQLRNQLVVSAAENLATVLIDGDTATGATTNINDIAGTPAGTEAFLLFDGFRKLALVTNTANSRAGGALATEDFLQTAVLMGPGGKVGADRKRVAFILDPLTHWTALKLAEVESKDIFSGAVIEGGQLSQIYGYPVISSYDMHRSSLALAATYQYKANTAGKIDLDTAANNTTGSLLAVRWDHWQLGMRRALTTEVQRIPRADAYEITSIMRFGLKNRDNEASAISYGITLA